MGTLHGVNSAARLLGVTPTSMYVETAKGRLRAKVDPTYGHMLWDEDDELFRARLDAHRAAREAFIAREDAKFRAINRRRPSTGNRG